VVFAIIIFTAVPVLLAQKLMGDSGRVAR